MQRKYEKSTSCLTSGVITQYTCIRRKLIASKVAFSVDKENFSPVLHCVALRLRNNST